MFTILQKTAKWYRAANYCLARAEVYLHEADHK